MASSKVVYISSISGGKCIENTQADKGECRLRKWNKSTTQQWTVESSEANPQEGAFRSVADGRYLAALQPDRRNGGKIGVQEEKQWWTLETGRGPGWFHVKSNSSFGSGKAGYLNDEWGRWQDDNKIQTYEVEEHNPGFNTFYFSFTDAADHGTFYPLTRVEDDDSGGKEEVESREQEFAQREKELVERDHELAKRDRQLSERDAQLAEREHQLAKREQSLKEREDAHAKGPEKPSQQTDNDKAIPNGAAESSNNDAERVRALDEREDILAKKEGALKQKAKQSQVTTGELSASHDDHEVCRLQRENDKLRLELKIKDLEQQLRQRACTHNVKRPPRKIDHKVIGYVYP